MSIFELELSGLLSEVNGSLAAEVVRDPVNGFPEDNELAAIEVEGLLWIIEPDVCEIVDLISRLQQASNEYTQYVKMLRGKEKLNCNKEYVEMTKVVNENLKSLNAKRAVMSRKEELSVLLAKFKNPTVVPTEEKKSVMLQSRPSSLNGQRATLYHSRQTKKCRKRRRTNHGCAGDTHHTALCLAEDKRDICNQAQSTTFLSSSRNKAERVITRDRRHYRIWRTKD
jgi:hypothetical protein